MTVNISFLHLLALAVFILSMILTSVMVQKMNVFTINFRVDEY